MPSVGMTHLPTAFLMAQSLWHSLPIWVTSTSVSANAQVSAHRQVL